MSNANRRVPLSLAELKQRREKQGSEISRPKFVNKAERQRAALERLEKKRLDEKVTRESAPPHFQNGAEHQPYHYDARPAKRPRHAAGVRNASDSLDEKELDAIRRHYMKLPTERTKSGAKKNSERGRFRFDWDEEDDTYEDEDVLRAEIRKQSDSALQYGQGKLSGMSDMLHKRVTQKMAYLRDTRHWSQKVRAEMTDRDWRIFREDYMISIRAGGGRAPNPARNWEETDLPADVLRLVKIVAKYDRPSAIQMATIPIGLEGRDFIGLAETGSGKTAAFVLPMLVHISRQPQMTPEIAARGPYALILAPTRELALQIDIEARKFAEEMGFRVVHVIGGQGLDEQVGLLGAGCEIVVCTPGRMVDLLGRQMAVLGNCEYLILDEADRMVDMGFEPQLNEILEAMPKGRKRQTFMFSATMSPAVERIAKNYLRDPIIVSVGETGKAADNVYQKVEYFATENRRRDRFLELLETLEAPILVFVNTKGGCEVVSKFVEASSAIRPVIMHSGKSQAQREKSLDGFKSRRYKVLIATDVVGRGIDIKGVRHVVNFELPKTIEAYTHRIGRTGRAGEKGTAWSLATEADVDLFGPLSQLLEKAGAQVPREIARETGGRGGRGFRPITD